MLVPALGAVAAGAAFRRGLADGAADDARTGVNGVVRDTLLLLTLVAALIAIGYAVVLGGDAHGTRAATSVVVTLVSSGAVAVLAALAWASSRREDAASRGLAWLVVGTAVVLGTVAVSVDAWKVVGVPVELALVAYGLPALLLLALLGPSVQEWGSSTRVEATGASTAYEWTPRPRRAPRPAKAAVPARAAEEHAPVETSVAPVDAPAHPTEAPVAAWPVAEEPSSAAEPAWSEPEPVEPAAAAQAPAAASEPQPEPEPVHASQPEPEPARAAADAQSTTVLPVAGYTAEQAADPSTPLEVLAQIAEHAPALRPYVASNPSTYTALLDWLGALGDPAVDAALQARPDRRR
ncbi:hypothetical protein GCM10025864_32970 [Luteimicrobium album]|uniref:Uncharacterized protein n=1 Tax=Luteimicrobium album TaxID=1054550 RepID=A0ABQ6I6G1_9MICO|nr:hypothetical protein GCM10025864_32970 [Luteimicrobium album]